MTDGGPAVAPERQPGPAAPRPAGPAWWSAPIRHDHLSRLTRLTRLRATAPAWVLALAVYAASRLFFGWVVARNAWLAGPRPDGSHYGYLDILANWDGGWYTQIVNGGYPAELPQDAAGHVLPNQWAFYPLYPGLVRGLAEVTGSPVVVAASVVSIAAGAVATVLVQQLVAAVAGRRLALWTVVLLCFFPAAPVLQLPYAEGTALALVAAVLLCLQRRHYLLGVPLVLLAGLARPVAVPLAAVVVLHALRLVVRRRRGQEVARRRTLAALGALCVASAVAAAAWPVVAGTVTGRRDAYAATEAAWWSPARLRLVEPWFDASRHYLGAVGPLLLVLTVAAAAIWVLRPGAAVIAGDLRAWCVCYLLYLLAALQSFTSLPRLLLPLFPLGTLLAAASPSRAYRVALTVAFAVGGVAWVAVVWRSKGLSP